MAPRRRGKKRRGGLIALIIIVVIVIIILAVFLRRYASSSETADYAAFYGLESEDDVILSFDDDILGEKGLFLDGETYVPYDVLHTYLNPRFYWDETERILRYTVPEGIVNVEAETEEYTVGEDPKTADHVIVHVEDGVMYLSVSFVEQYTDIRTAFYENPNREVISDRWGKQEYHTVKRDTQVRELGGTKSSVLCEVSKGDKVTVLDEMDSWTEVCTEDGFVGYIKNRALGGAEEENRKSDFEEPEFPHIFEDHMIDMAWHQVSNQTANGAVSSVLAEAPGINVISPTWFYLNDDEGGIVSFAGEDYVSYCHRQGIEVWALVSNLENPDVDTTKVLSVTSSRDALVDNLISQAVQYGTDGINIDFEQLEGEAGAGYLQFIRELSLECEDHGLVLSIDNYPPASYNSFYSRQEQAVFADYIVLMAYDEHYNGSDAGSVASLSFVEQSVEDTLKEVPSDQIILGIPFYARLWKLTPDDSAEGGYAVSSEALGMSDARQNVSAHGARPEWQEDAGQYYAEYEYGGSTYEIWLEDRDSIGEKLGVMRENGLAGAAFWKLGYETPDVWDTINGSIN